jgi:hypothetical protein
MGMRMISNTILLRCATLGLSLSLTMATPGVAIGADPAHVSVTAHLIVDATDGPILEVELTNMEAVPIEMNEDGLPWGIRDSLFLVAFQFNVLQEQLKQQLYIDDPGPAVVTIGPGDKLSGRIKLSERFDDLVAIAKNKPVIFFWSYPYMWSEAVGVTQRSGGWVLLPKQSP